MTNLLPMPRRRRHVGPTTFLGAAALALAALALAAAIATVAVVASGQRGGNSIFDNLWISAPALAAAGLALAALFVGLVAVARRHERSLAVWATIIATGLAWLFIIGEVAVPS